MRSHPIQTRRLAAPLERHVLRAAAALLLCILGLVALAPRAEAFEHRRRTPSAGGQLQAGVIQFDSDWAHEFDWGRGATIRLRQYVARNRAIGISFEQQKFREDTTLPQLDPAFDADYVQMQILMLDYYMYFRRHLRVSPYVVGSIGFYRPELVDEVVTPGGNKETLSVVHPGENLLARVGVGLEYFVARTFSIDATVSGYYLNAPDLGGVTATAQVALGVQIYAGR